MFGSINSKMAADGHLGMMARYPCVTWAFLFLHVKSGSAKNKLFEIVEAYFLLSPTGVAIVTN